MLLLKRRDYLPSVAGIQLILNTYRHSDRQIAVDGKFGDDTENAVRNFQRMFPGVLRPDGIVGPNTWQRLARADSLKVRDWADVSDPLLFEAVEAVGAVNSVPIQAQSMSFAVATIANSITASGVKRSELFLIRFLGHGNQGLQAIAYGTGCHILYNVIRRIDFQGWDQCFADYETATEYEKNTIGTAQTYSSLSERSFTDPLIISAITPLKYLLCRYGSIEFHGCQIGGGEKGKRFLQSAANFFNVPCCGAQGKQFAANAIRFRGRIEVACPQGKALNQWAQELTPIPISRIT